MKPKKEKGPEMTTLGRKTLGKIQTGYKKNIFYDNGSEALEQVVQRCGGCPILAYRQGGQARLGPEQPDLAVDVPVHCSMGSRGVGLDDL